MCSYLTYPMGTILFPSLATSPTRPLPSNEESMRCPVRGFSLDSTRGMEVWAAGVRPVADLDAHRISRRSILAGLINEYSLAA